MNRLRALAGMALIAGLFAGLSSCANKKGDLGAELDAPPVVASGPAQGNSPRRTTLDITSPADIPDAETVELSGNADPVDLADPKNRTPQSVSINRDTKLTASAKKQQGLKKDAPESAPIVSAPVAPAAPAQKFDKITADLEFGPQPAPKDDVKNESPKPEAKKEESTPVVSAPVAPANPAQKPDKVTAELEFGPQPAPKDDVKNKSPKPEAKKEESTPVVSAPVTPVLAPEKSDKIIADSKVEPKPTPKDDVKNDAPKSESKKEESAPVAITPALPAGPPEKSEKADKAASVATKEDAPKADSKKEESAPVALPATPEKSEKAIAEAKAEPKPASKEEAKIETPKAIDSKPDVSVAPAAKISVEPAEALERAKAALALLNRQADDVTHSAAVKPALVAPDAVANAPKPSTPAKLDETGATAAIPKKALPAPEDDDVNKQKGKAAPKPGDPPVNDTAEERLKAAERAALLQRQASRQEAEAAYQAGLRLYSDWEYAQAKIYFEKALALDPSHEQAREKLATVKSLLNIDMGVGQIIRNLSEAERVKMQEQSITLAHYMEEARSFETRGSETVLDSGSGDKIRSLSERLRFLEQAQDRYRRMIEIINWMPPAAELPGLRRQAEEALLRVRGKIDKINEEVGYNTRMIAQQENDRIRRNDTELARVRLNKMLEHVQALLDIHDYKGAEQMALRVLIADPLNADAEKLKKRARALSHDNEKREFQSLYREEYRTSMQDNDEQQISSAPLIQYPANWDQISKRTDVSIGRRVAEDPWKSEIRKRLQRKVTFEFVDTPLADAVDFLRRLANVTMIIDPKVLAANPPQINLRVTDMNLDLALEWILKLAELEYVLQDSAIFISKPQTLQPPLEMKIYDVSDLTQNIQDFPGPEFQITVAGDKGAAGGGGGALTPFGGGNKPQAPTNATIQEMIKTRIRPDMWDPATGASIEEKGGKLVVMQRPEIHKLIDQLLSNFRSTQKMMINIESRFLTIREAYLEQTGVEFQGLDPNVLFGDFGDLRRLGAPTGFIQPRVPGSTDTSPPNIPFPGIVSGPTPTNGGLFSTVGSIVNHSINFFPNDPDTISAQDTTNTVRQGGMSAQLTILNNAQVQAFIRALAVRENSSTLIAPRLTVFNTQRANMFVARQQSYVSDYEISGDSYDPVVRQFLVGVVLDVKPIVSSDRRYVTLELRPTVTDLTNFVTRQIDTFTVNSGAQVNVLVLLSFPIQFPELSIQKVRTTATVPDGGIMLIGGLYKNIKFNAENGVPFVSDLPVIGRLFRWNVVDNAKSNLAILISPRIILFNEEEEKLIYSPTPGPLYLGERREEKIKCK